MELKSFLAPYGRLLGEAAQTILDEGVSRYPILVVCQDELEVGIPLFSLTDGWSARASTLEEFVVRQLIGQEKLDDFRDLYRSHEKDLCFFVAGEAEAYFAFLPKPTKNKT